MKLIDQILRQPAFATFGRATSGPGGAPLLSLAHAQFDTLAEVPGASVGPDVEILATLGHATVGDGGAALFRRVALEPAHAGKTSTSDGSWWEMMSDPTGLRPQQFGARGDDVTDDTAALQQCLDTAFALDADVFIPAGTYLVTGLTLPGLPADRAKAQTIRGQGTGEALVLTNDGGTVIRSVTDAPVLEDILDTDPSSNGSVLIEGIRFDGTSDTAPVIRLQSFFGLSRMRNCVIRQRGSGNGVDIAWCALVEIEHCFAFNADTFATGIGPSRTGIGWRFANTHNAALVTFRKVSARGFRTGFEIDGSAAAAIATRLTDCQVSVITNGLRLIGTRGAVVTNLYCEGGEGGTGIEDTGDYTTIQNCYVGSGFLTLINATDVNAKGTVIENNLISLGAETNAVGIDVASSAAFGGYNKTVRGNAVAVNAGTDGVTGIRITGTEPRLSIVDNSFDPRGDWTGAGTAKLRDLSTGGGISGLVQRQSGEQELLQLSQGALSLFQPTTALDETDVAAGLLTVPSGSFFRFEAGTPVTVTAFDVGAERNRIVLLRTTNANATIQSTARITLAGGGSFTGPGTLMLVIEQSGGLSFAYEITRTLF